MAAFLLFCFLFIGEVVLAIVLQLGVREPFVQPKALSGVNTIFRTPSYRDPQRRLCLQQGSFSWFRLQQKSAVSQQYCAMRLHAARRAARQHQRSGGSA